MKPSQGRESARTSRLSASAEPTPLPERGPGAGWYAAVRLCSSIGECHDCGHTFPHISIAAYDLGHGDQHVFLKQHLAKFISRSRTICGRSGEVRLTRVGNLAVECHHLLLKLLELFKRPASAISHVVPDGWSSDPDDRIGERATHVQRCDKNQTLKQSRLPNQSTSCGI